MQVASAFSQMLNLHNLSEEISNAQIEKASRIGEVSRGIKPTRCKCNPIGCDNHSDQPPHRDLHIMQIEASTRSTNKSFKKLVADKLATPEQIYETICNQTVDLVFTAHPTQVIRGRLHTPVPSVMPGRAP